MGVVLWYSLPGRPQWHCLPALNKPMEDAQRMKIERIGGTITAVTPLQGGLGDPPFGSRR
jgi:hypothetical protein